MYIYIFLFTLSTEWNAHLDNQREWVFSPLFWTFMGNVVQKLQTIQNTIRSFRHNSSSKFLQ